MANLTTILRFASLPLFLLALYVSGTSEFNEGLAFVLGAAATSPLVFATWMQPADGLKAKARPVGGPAEIDMGPFFGFLSLLLAFTIFLGEYLLRTTPRLGASLVASMQVA